ncbi:SBBP repeat-containing protein [Laspinema palackyanum]|uniref:SBBP repeat-containing protein n=1 Tax=Laspinema palackyanum TaxID=3231601 RepID=UPI00345C8592|nr:SBBP repeat-containing protein [Laspinema sp. D2c]
MLTVSEPDASGHSTTIHPQLPWIQQLGSANDDRAYGIARDPLGHLYLGGQTQGGLGGTPQGDWDIWFAKYHPNGTPLWIQQLGSAQDDRAYTLTSDPLGNLYIAGTTSGTLAETNGAGYDALIAKYDSNGNPLWIKQFGSVTTDDARSLTTDSMGDVYIAGDTWGDLGGVNRGESDAWFGKYDSNGNLLWVQQLGTPSEDRATGVEGDRAGNLYVTGYTFGSLGAAKAGDADAWVAKYDSTGQQQWVRQFGTEGEDQSNGLALDSAGNIYLTGWTEGTLGESSAGSWDAWVAKYDPTGNLVWIEQFGSANSEGALDIKIDGNDRIYLTGNTWGAIEGHSNTGESDIWVAQYDTNGDRLGGFQFGSTAADSPFGMTVDDAGRVYLGGWTLGDLSGSNPGDYDAWIAQILPNADPILTQNTGLTFEKGATVAIAPTQLQVSDPDGDAIVYTLTSIPKQGALILNQTALTLEDTFTQADIDAGLLFYHSNSWSYSNDSFEFTATDGKGSAIGPTEFTLTRTQIPPTLPSRLEWIRQFESSESGSDSLNGMAVDPAGNLFLTGATLTVNGYTHAWANLWVGQYNPQGEEVWRQNFGQDYYDISTNLTLDNAGNVFVTGLTQYSPGFPSVRSGYFYRGSDAWVTQYDPQGNFVTTYDIRENPSAFNDSASEIALDQAGNLYVRGTRAADPQFPRGDVGSWVTKHDPQGNPLWVKQFPTESLDYATSLAVEPAGTFYLSGYTDFNELAPLSASPWVAKYDTNGEPLWEARLETNYTAFSSTKVALDPFGAVYLTGYSMNSHGDRSFSGPWLAKYNSNGEQEWFKPLEMEGLERAEGLVIDPAGNISLTGTTRADLVQGNSRNIWVAQYNTNGEQLWIEQLGSSEFDTVLGIAVDGGGNLYLAGSTDGDLGGMATGGTETWIAKLNPHLTLDAANALREQIWPDSEGAIATTIPSDRTFTTGADWHSVSPLIPDVTREEDGLMLADEWIFGP